MHTPSAPSVPFEQLLAAYAPRALAAAIGLLGDEQEGREVAQESLLRAYRARDRYDGRRPFYPWLYTIVRNASFDARARRRHRAVGGLDGETVRADSPAPDDQAAHAEQLAVLRRALDTVSDEHREILSMRHFQDLSYAEIGMLLGVPQGTVMSRLFRARKALIEAMTKEGA